MTRRPSYLKWKSPTRIEWVGPRPSRKVDWPLVKDNLRVAGAFITAIGIFKLVTGDQW